MEYRMTVQWSDGMTHELHFTTELEAEKAAGGFKLQFGDRIKNISVTKS